MIGYADALERLLALGRPLAAETVPLKAALGRVPVADVVATRTQPPFPTSAMDGYAVAGDGPWRLAGEVAAGSAPGLRLGGGEAARILTGAPVPEGAAAILILENAAVEGALLRVGDGAAPPEPGANIRAEGGDFRAGARLHPAGVPLRAASLALIAAGGHGALSVGRRPRVAVLATGDELVPPGAEPGPGQIVESNRAALLALLDGLAEPIDLGIARDDLEAIGAAVARGREADVLVTVGGASVGDRDLVLPALEAAGAKIGFWKVAIRPGKPTLAGRLGDAVVLGLPGNPASAFVTAQLFLLPLVRHLAGWAEPGPKRAQARLEAGIGANGPRRDHLRGRLGWDGPVRTVRALPAQDSSLMSVMAAADALIVREIGAPAAAAGDVTEVLDIANRPQ